MKIIFLDIDGVLNGMEFFDRTKDQREALVGENEVFGHWAAMIDEEAVKVLNAVIEKTGAKIVLSSSWRHAHSLSDMRGYLKAKGFTGQLIDKTPKRAPNPPYRRGNEIQAWLAEHSEVEKFVILDDDSDMEHLSPKLVQTSWQYGLKEQHIEPILRHLT